MRWHVEASALLRVVARGVVILIAIGAVIILAPVAAEFVTVR